MTLYTMIYTMIYKAILKNSFRFSPAGAIGSGRVFLRKRSPMPRFFTMPVMSFVLVTSLVISLVLVVGLWPVTVWAYAVPGSLRVGLERQFKEKESISITNSTIWVGYTFGGTSGGISVGTSGGTSGGISVGTSVGVNNGVFTPLATLSAAGGFVARPENGACIQMPGLYTTYEQALSAAGVYNGVYVPALGAYGEWLVYSIQFASDTAAKQEAAAMGGTFLSASGQRVVLYAGGVPVGLFDNNVYNLQIKDAYGGTLSLGGTQYRGIIELGRYAGQKLTAVNVLSMDEYLFSVVPSEMSAAFQPEALKAQAVAARSYTLTRSGVHQAQGYDICDQSHCQNYQGAGNENAAALRAVTDTSGLVATYGGQPINAVFFSSSGGATDHSENVWSTALPYLRSVIEINEHEPREWTRTFTMNEITSLLTQQNAGIGAATAVAITRTASTGRVQALTIYGTLGTKVIVKEAIRSFFSASAGGMLDSRNFTIANGVATNGVATNGVMANEDMANGSAVTETNPVEIASVVITDGASIQVRAVSDLYAVSAASVASAASAASAESQAGELALLTAVSATDGQAVTVYRLTQSNTGTSTVPNTVSNTTQNMETVVSTGSSVVFTGKGWGHGVGMSQRGAEGMARLGFDYITILKHYYTGITIE